MGHHHTKKPYLELLGKPVLAHTIGVVIKVPLLMDLC